uniref:Uncharacterized protein n=1 Tax=Glossina pallidipes TaxID=7398 RepID=A0A1B0A8Q0_GLOPL
MATDGLDTCNMPTEEKDALLDSQPNNSCERHIKKLDNKNYTPLTSSFTNDSIENQNNGSDESDDDDDDDQHNHEINDVNNIDDNEVEVDADNDIAMAASTNVVHNTEDPPYVGYVGNQEEGEADFRNAEEDMNIDETFLESSLNTIKHY